KHRDKTDGNFDRTYDVQIDGTGNSPVVDSKLVSPLAGWNKNSNYIIYQKRKTLVLRQIDGGWTSKELALNTKSENENVFCYNYMPDAKICFVSLRNID